MKSTTALRFGLIAALTLAVSIAFASPAPRPLEPTSGTGLEDPATGIPLPGAEEPGDAIEEIDLPIETPDVDLPETPDLPGPAEPIAKRAFRAVARVADAVDDAHGDLTRRVVSLADVLPEPVRPLFFADLGPAGAIAATYCEFEAAETCWGGEGS